MKTTPLFIQCSNCNSLMALGEVLQAWQRPKKPTGAVAALWWPLERYFKPNNDPKSLLGLWQLSDDPWRGTSSL